MIDSPFELLCRDKNFSEQRVNASLAAVQTCSADDLFLVVK